MIGVIHGGQINYGSATVLGSEISIANWPDQPEELQGKHRPILSR